MENIHAQLRYLALFLFLSSSLPLGIIADAEFEQIQIAMRYGDRLTMMTDGVVEAQTRNANCLASNGPERPVTGMLQKSPPPRSNSASRTTSPCYASRAVPRIRRSSPAPFKPKEGLNGAPRFDSLVVEIE